MKTKSVHYTADWKRVPKGINISISMLLEISNNVRVKQTNEGNSGNSRIVKYGLDKRDKNGNCPLELLKAAHLFYEKS